MVIDLGSVYNFPYEFDKVFNEVFNPRQYKRGKASYPPINIGEDEKNVYVHAEMPGLAIEDMDIEITAKDLVIKGERKLPEGRYFRQERTSGVFQRIISINTLVDVDNVSASMKDGILRIIMPKAESSVPKKIAVEIE
ncbi:Hsp20/alpha crystallin family protein [Maridesulfovibrio ferrireducens]|uniref:Hsp20/alpha crystallin family protein n=1 Tax=Maridesulfovibrio ferrireducens TaxID=246191 RepID=UPI001A2F4556|nr:Hsp20/alpha crystallin family protein [Maridesulfovibrio ferrireducens]MBI9111270.1 Hsp20/alpha crystallin family protein [Maridesulfovibrio ferrireducens]